MHTPSPTKKKKERERGERRLWFMLQQCVFVHLCFSGFLVSVWLWVIREQHQIVIECVPPCKHKHTSKTFGSIWFISHQNGHIDTTVTLQTHMGTPHCTVHALFHTLHYISVTCPQAHHLSFFYLPKCRYYFSLVFVNVSVQKMVLYVASSCWVGL